MRRRQKKVLSLVLCVAMMLSVMVVGAGAAFSDQSKIKNTEAVDACTALNIIGGYPDGSFKPEGNITRAEVTKMICVALNGGKNPAVSTNTTPTFSDVRNNANAAWAEGYIESCAAQGIVSGVGGGKFAPNGNVTGVQMAKMLLVSLGYKADIEGFTGNAWATNVNVRAAQKGLYKGLESMDTNAALTRDNAAQMIWNALKAYEVEYVTNLVADKDGKLSTQITVQDKIGSNNRTKITLLIDKYDADITKNAGTLVAVKEDNKGTYTITIDGQDDPFTKVEKDYSDLLGQKVDLLVNKDNEVFGVYANEDSSVVATGYVGALEKDGSKTDKIKLDGTSYKLDGNIYDAVGDEANKIVLTANTTATQTLKALVDSLGLKGNIDANVAASSIKLIDNTGDGKIDAAVYTPVKVGKVTAVSKTSVTINNGNNTVKFEDADVYSGIAKDDYVMFLAETNRSAKDKGSITKINVISGKIVGTRTVTSKTSEVKIDNTWYKVAKTAPNMASGDSYDVAVVGDTVLFGDMTAASSKDILTITGVKGTFTDPTLEKEIGDTDSYLKAKAYFVDGTSSEIKITKIAGAKITDSNKVAIAEASLYTYSKLSDGTYDVKALTNTNNAGYDAVSDNAQTYNKQKIGKKTLADDAVVFVVAKDETKVLTGKQVKAWGDNEAFSGMYAATESNGIDYIKVASLVSTTAPVPNADGDIKYGFMVADSYASKMDGEDGTKTAYDVWTSEGAKTLYVDGTGDPVASGSVLAYKEDGKYITISDSFKPTKVTLSKDSSAKLRFDTVAITGFDYTAEGTLAVVKSDNDTEDKTLNKDCVFIAVNSKDEVGMEGAMSGVQFANTVNADTNKHYANAIIVTINDSSDSDNGDVMAVIYDANDVDWNGSFALGK